LRNQAHPHELLGQFAVGLFSHQFVAGVTPPKIDAGHLEKLTGRATEKLDQRGGIGPLRSLTGYSQQKLLKRIVGARRGAAFE
jgi:hypothetical protein